MTTKKRLTIFALAFISISSVAFLVIKFAQGYRPDFSGKTLKPTGLLVATSVPDGAQLWLDGKLESATDTTLNLSPGEYLVEIKKDGFTTWKKKLKVKKELVTQTDAYLFSTYPDLKALTFTGAANPLLSPDGQKVIFSVSSASVGKNGLWVLDLSDRPLGLSREPRQIIASAPGGRDFSQADYQWSPDSEQILITLKDRPENFILETDRLNLAINLIEIGENLPQIFKNWQEEKEIRQKAQLKKLPKEFLEVVDGAVNDIQFSPDEDKIIYTATASASIPEEIVTPLPAANTQPESRQIEPGKIYVYDLKEDKNFFIIEKEKLNIESRQNSFGDSGGQAGIPNKESEKNGKVIRNSRFEIRDSAPPALSWFPTSKHLFLVQNDKITIMEYDRTNWLDVYSGPFENSFAFPFPSGKRILVLASIGKDTPPNLYAISLR